MIPLGSSYGIGYNEATAITKKSPGRFYFVMTRFNCIYFFLCTGWPARNEHRHIARCSSKTTLDLAAMSAPCTG